MKLILLAFGLLVSHFAIAQTIVPFDTSHWTFTGKIEPDTFKGKTGIKLSEGALYLNDSTFVNGIIEFDMTLTKSRYFPGVGFRLQNPENFEFVYLRPHQLGNPDAIQYIPIFNLQDSWQLYYGDGYSTAITYPLDEWVHIKLLVRETQAEVYVDDMSKPGLVIHRLKRTPKPGRIRLDNGAPVVTRFANFQYAKTDNPPFQGTFKPEAAPQKGTIRSWQVSNTFDEKLLDSNYSIPQDLARQLTWQTVRTENSGVINLSQISKLREGHNTIFTKLVIVSDKPQVKKLQFGFSDRVKVYVNGTLVYGGQDVFTSRDYRFLGTIGYFDEVYLDLKKGQNEVWMAVSETFGGWGIQGKLVDQNGLTITP
ncbi:hypothetical protein [Spirosoma sp. KNUC1025]|uniref:hypothetical protein n=1 Tax=Spirosoma sp. KNUC1025 TaxID=2894082 RepID=UPI003866C896|nr:DUF1080 domain-containing protein [Spirosoma sp. KNUC1025]